MGDEGRGGARRPLTYEDRLMIEQGLYRGDRISTIARALGRSQSTVEREVRRNFTDSPHVGDNLKMNMGDADDNPYLMAARKDELACIQRRKNEGLLSFSSSTTGAPPPS